MLINSDTAWAELNTNPRRPWRTVERLDFAAYDPADNNTMVASDRSRFVATARRQITESSRPLAAAGLAG